MQQGKLTATAQYLLFAPLEQRVELRAKRTLGNQFFSSPSKVLLIGSFHIWGLPVRSSGHRSTRSGQRYPITRRFQHLSNLDAIAARFLRPVRAPYQRVDIALARLWCDHADTDGEPNRLLAPRVLEILQLDALTQFVRDRAREIGQLCANAVCSGRPSLDPFGRSGALCGQKRRHPASRGHLHRRNS